MKALIGKKIGMTMIYKGDIAMPVTIVKAGPCVVVQKKSNKLDGYDAIQIGFEEISTKHTNKPMEGHFKKADVKFQRYLKEIKLDNVDDYNVGQILDVSIFEEGELIDVSARTEGKGFQGAVKRWHFAGHDRTHGSKYPKHGSTGMHTYPGRVLKGTKMAGHMGNVNRTILNLEVVKVSKDNSLMAVKGALPGKRGSVVYLRSAVRGGK